MVFKFRIEGLLISAALFLLLLSSCEQGTPPTVMAKASESEVDSAHWVIQKSIDYHGGNFTGKTLQFEFREKRYKGIFSKKETLMVRSFTKNDSSYVDSISNDKAIRTLQNQNVDLSEKKNSAIVNAVNSVFYFVMLPSKLKDPAVVSEYLGIENSNTGSYHKVAVSFKQDGGGDDFQDKFMYWFDAQTFQMTFLAYSYETNGGGIRFRSVEKEHKLPSGYVLQDYVNYKTDSLGTKLEDLLTFHSSKRLKKISTIKLKLPIIH